MILVITSFLKLKKDDLMLDNPTFWARIRPETFLRVRSKPNPAELTTLQYEHVIKASKYLDFYRITIRFWFFFLLI